MGHLLWIVLVIVLVLVLVGALGRSGTVVYPGGYYGAGGISIVGILVLLLILYLLGVI